MKQSRILKSVQPVIAALVLLGMVNCMFVEPVLALNHQETECVGENGHCCFLCNPSQHQWNLFSSVDFVQPADIAVSLVSSKLQTYSYSSPVFIFHPPPVSLRI